MLRAATAGDLKTIWSLTDPNVQATVSEQRGIEALKKEWRISQSPQTFLKELAAVLSLGGRFEDESKQTFVAPYIWTDFPDTTSMPDYRVVVRRNAPVFKAPSERSSVLARLSYDVLRAMSAVPGAIQGWSTVKLPNGRRGYMRDVDARAPSDTRAYFSKVGGHWKLSGFYGGID